MATKEVIEAMKFLRDAYPNRKIENWEAFIETADIALSGYRPMVVLVAMRKLVIESKFFPTIAEMRHKAEGLENTAIQLTREFTRWVQKYEFKKPPDWTAEDKEEFMLVMGRPVNWATEPKDAPWMWWKVTA